MAEVINYNAARLAVRQSQDTVRKASKKRSITARLLRSPSGLIGMILCLIPLLIVALGPYFAPYGVDDFVGVPFDAPSAELLLGADMLGRDVLSRILMGGKLILVLAFFSAVLGVIIGAFFGVAAAYCKGVVDELIMRTVDILLAFPQTVFALLILSVLGPRMWLIVLIVAIVHASPVARVARAAALRVIEEDFVSYAELIGASRIRIIMSEVLPNISTPLLVELGLRFTYSIALIAGLNFIGFGVQPPAADWGLMINENRVGMETNPWPVVVPIILIAILTVGVNMLTDFFARISRGERGVS